MKTWYARKGMLLSLGLMTFLLMNADICMGQTNQTDSLGKKQGRWLMIDKKGKLVKECFYVNDTLNGKYLVYFPSGEIAESVIYIMGREEGLYQRFSMRKGNRIPSLEIEYHNGMRNGAYKFYDKRGNLVNYCDYLNDAWHGKRVGYLKGRKVFEAGFKYGILHGDYIEYYDDGMPSLTITFYEGKLLSGERRYDRQGRERMRKLPSQQRDVFLEQIEFDENGKEKRVKIINEKPITYYLFGANVHRKGELGNMEEGKGKW